MLCCVQSELMTNLQSLPNCECLKAKKFNVFKTENVLYLLLF